MSFKIPDEWISDLLKSAETIRWEGDKPPDRSWIIRNIADVDGLLCTITNRIDREVIDAAKRLRVISTYSVGYDHIDVEHARSRGILIGYTPEVLTDATADLTMALLLAVARRVVEGDRTVREGRWKGWSPDFMLGTEVHGKTLGIVGMGRIGRAVARRARGFDMRVIYNSRTRKPDVDAEYVELDELLSESDYVVITVDLNESTYHMVNEGFLRRMKSSAYLINASRGKVVDESALARALKEGWIRGAGLDVFEEELLSPESPLAGLENVVLTPHLGSATVETRMRMAEVAVRNLLNGLEGLEMPYRLP